MKRLGWLFASCLWPTLVFAATTSEFNPLTSKLDLILDNSNMGVITGITATFSGYNCTTYASGGALTTDASGNLKCSDDDTGGGGANSFETWAVPAGTNPVADSATDTVTFTASGLTVTGTASSDTVDFTVTQPLQTLNGDLSVTSTGVATIQANAVALTADTTGNYQQDMSCAETMSGCLTAGEGTQPTIGVKGSSLTSAHLNSTNAGTTGQALTKAVGGNFTWTTHIASGDSAGGDLTGTYPNPTVTTNAVALTTDTTGNYLQDLSCAETMSGCLAANEGVQPTLGVKGSSLTASHMNATNAPTAGQCLTYGSGPFTWAACGGAAGNSFETWVTPAGTSPVADSSTDTVTFTASGLTVTGTAASDAIDFALTVPLQTVTGDVLFTSAGVNTIQLNAVALATDTTGNYVATLADSGNTTVTVANSGTENAAVTLNVIDVNCTNCLGPTEISDLTLATDTAGNFVQDLTCNQTMSGCVAAGENTQQLVGVKGSSITNAYLFTSNSPTNGQCLTYTSASGAFTWAACGGSSSNSFETWSTPSGTNPVADSSTDTVTYTASGITVTGTASSDTIDFTLTQPIQTFSGDVNVTSAGVATIQLNAVALTTDTTGNYANGDAEAGNALTGDSATAFFSAGQIELARGGTNASLTADNGAVAYSTGSAIALVASTATANKVLMSGASTTPTWSIPTFPNASSASGILVRSDGTNWVASTPSYPNIASDDSVMVGNGTNYITTMLTNCTDTSGNHLNYTATSNAFSCGTTRSTASYSMNLPIYSAKLTGAFVVRTPTNGDASTQGAQINAGDGNWNLLFDPTTDEAAVWQFVLPANWTAHGTLDVYYSMASATSGTVEFEGDVMCITSGDSADIGTASFAGVAVNGAETVPGTAGYPKKVTITLTDDSCAAGDVMFVYLSTDANDAVNDTATGDREVVGLNYNYTGN